jgi:hypothetical protein
VHTLDTSALAHAHRDPEVVDRRRVHALVFDDPHRTLEAVKRLRAEGFDVGDVHSPFPVHGMEEALGMRPTRLAWATLVGGLAGGSLKLLFQSWVHIVDWPMNIGGKPDFSLPALVPVTFELTVLVGAFATLGALFVRRRLYPRVRPERAARQPHRGVTDDRFVVLVLEHDGAFSPRRFEAVCSTLGAQEVTQGWRSAA